MIGAKLLVRRKWRLGICIGLVLELVAPEPAVRFGEFTRLGDHAAALVCGWGQDHFCPKEAHQLAALDGEVLCHHNHQRIAFARADHREPDARVAAGRLDHGLARTQRAAALGRLDYAKGHSVLDRAERVKEFQLRVKRDMIRR